MPFHAQHLWLQWIYLLGGPATIFPQWQHQLRAAHVENSSAALKLTPFVCNGFSTCLGAILKSSNTAKWVISPTWCSPTQFSMIIFYHMSSSLSSAEWAISLNAVLHRKLLGLTWTTRWQYGLQDITGQETLLQWEKGTIPQTSEFRVASCYIWLRRDPLKLMTMTKLGPLISVGLLWVKLNWILPLA